MEIPNLVRRQLGGEEIEAGVNLGDEDTICLTPSRTLLYRAEGLLSDEKVQEFPHNVERVDVSEGRRKTKFVLEYVEGERSFTVPKNRDTQVLELLMDGILRKADVTDPDESVTGVFRFSELALVITEGRVVKHIGSSVWSEDYEVLAYDDLSELAFERGSVATEIVMTIDDRPHRIKTPNDHAKKVQQVLERAVFSHYDVGSLDELNRKLGDTDATPSENRARARDDRNSSGGSDIDIGGGIDPLVDSENDDADSSDAGRSNPPDAQTSDASAGSTATSSSSGRSRNQSDQEATTQTSRTRDRSESRSTGDGSADGEELAAVEAQLDELTAAVQEQNELLKKQQQTISKLIEELRDGR